MEDSERLAKAAEGHFNPSRYAGLVWGSQLEAALARIFASVRVLESEPADADYEGGRVTVVLDGGRVSKIWHG